MISNDRINRHFLNKRLIEEFSDSNQPRLRIRLVLVLLSFLAIALHNSPCGCPKLAVAIAGSVIEYLEVAALPGLLINKAEPCARIPI
jgi:hypothetical protein